ncbi:MAG: MerC domain-containing protein [Pseudomonadota bacterium]
MAEDARPVLAAADKVAIGLSLLCCAHCLFVPLALAFAPALVSFGLADEGFHLWLVFAVIPISVIALSWGCRTHRSLSVIATGLLGLAILCTPLLLGHEVVGEWGERLLTVAGALLIAFSHLKNFRLCQSHDERACVN